MSKFAAWATKWTPNNHGIRLQAPGVEKHQQRQQIAFDGKETYYLGSVVHVSSTEPGWDAVGLLDQKPNTVWSSVRSPTEEANEWFAFWWPDRQRVNLLELTPRRSTDGKAYCFPKKVQIHYAAGPNNWQLVREVDLNDPPPLDPGTQPGSVLVSLDRTIETDGLRVTAKQLRIDDWNHYYFQMAGVRACYRTLTFDESRAKASAEEFPEHLFFFGDEPDTYLPADVYACVYDKFVASIKSGSRSAKVSPAGFTFDNDIYGSSYTAYAEKFYEAKHTPVDEWRFHRFYSQQDYPTWEARVKEAETWSVDHGAPMVLGSFDSPGVSKDVEMRGYQWQAMEMISRESHIVEAVWWSYDWPDPPELDHRLVNPDETLTEDGKSFVSFDMLNRVWGSGLGNWSWERSRAVAGDFRGRGRDDIAVFYNYDNDDTALFLFGDDSEFRPI